MMNQEVRQIMTTNPKVAVANQNVKSVTSIMQNENISQIPVISTDGKLLGVITSEILIKVHESNMDLTEILATDIMNTNVIKITPKDKVGTAAELFADKRFKTLPVVNLRNELKGVITAWDLVKTAFNVEYRSPILYNEAFA